MFKKVMLRSDDMERSGSGRRSIIEGRSSSNSSNKNKTLLELAGLRKNSKGVVILGIQGSGKTSVMYQITSKKFVQTMPTLGSDVQSAKLNGHRIDFVEIGGSEKLRELWPQYTEEADAIIFVVDASDKGGLTHSQQALHNLIQQCPVLAEKPLLVLANKSDKPEAEFAHKVEKCMDIDSAIVSTNVVMAVSSQTGSGIQPAMMWLTSKW